MNIVAVAVVKKAAVAPKLNQISPVSELASMVQMLCKPENVPMAVAVSFLSEIFEIHAFEIPSVQGLWKKPTVLNNVETLASIAQIILNGGQWYADTGTLRSKGTKVFALTGAPTRIDRLKFKRLLLPGDEAELRLTRRPDGKIAFAYVGPQGEHSSGVIAFGPTP